MTETTLTKNARRESARLEGWRGWDEYAPFYDWENSRTMGRRDVRFWRDLAVRIGGPVLELGAGTGRVSVPLARAGVRTVGVDRAEQMLAIGRRRSRRAGLTGQLAFVRGDIRALPFASAGSFPLVIAPYGVLQSLLSDEDLDATLSSVASLLAAGGVFGMELVADVPAWDEYQGRVRFRGARRGAEGRVTLIESVRQDAERRLTVFEQEYVERRGSREVRRSFSLAFRTLSVPEMAARLERAGFDLEHVLGDYDGRPWDVRANAWLLIARRR